MQINNLLQVVSGVLNKEKHHTLNFPKEFTFFHTLERVQQNVQAIELLMKNDPIKYDHAIGLICRNLLSDFITIGYIVKLSKDEEELFMNLYSLYYTDLNRAESFLFLYEKAGIVTADDRKKYDDIKSAPLSIHKFVFDYAKEFEVKKFPSNARIIELFIENSNPDDIWANEIIKSYDLWLFYSKYEHVGWSSYGITRDISDDKITERLESVLRKTLLLLMGCFLMLEEKDAYKYTTDLIKETAIFSQ